MSAVRCSSGSQCIHSTPGHATAPPPIKVQMSTSPGRHDMLEPVCINAAESIEIDTFLDMFAAAPSGFASANKSSTIRFSDFICLGLGSSPTTIFNRSLRTTRAHPTTEASVDEALHWMRQYAVPEWSIDVFSMDAATSPTALWLKQQSLVAQAGGRERSWQGLGADIPPCDTRLDIRRVDAMHADTLSRIGQQGFNLPANFAEWFCALPGWLAGRAGIPTSRSMTLSPSQSRSCSLKRISPGLEIGTSAGLSRPWRPIGPSVSTHGRRDLHRRRRNDSGNSESATRRVCGSFVPKRDSCRLHADANAQLLQVKNQECPLER